MIFTVGLSVAIRMSLRWSATELERREAVKSRTEAELKKLAKPAESTFSAQHPEQYLCPDGL